MSGDVGRTSWSARVLPDPLVCRKIRDSAGQEAGCGPGGPPQQELL
jgi:hypothetical protein